MIDLHCHLLPGLDDGPSTMDESLELARRQVERGVRRVAATSHVDWNFQNRSPALRRLVTEVGSELQRASVPLKLVGGGEIAMTVAPDLADDELEALHLGDGPWLLLEAPLSPSAIGFDHVISYLQVRGHQILLAHPERSPAFHRDPDLLPRLVEGGALAQVTASAFTGTFGRTVQDIAFGFAAQGLVHVVASDAHDAVRRPPGLREPLEAAGLGDFVSYWCEDMPRAILDGGPLPAPPSPPPDVAPRKRRRFGRG